jgi:CarD family transcriptional regulator
MSEIMQFKVGDNVVYPSHGVGKVVDIESQVVIGTAMQVYVISFPNDKMTLKVPVSRASVSGLRSILTEKDVSSIYEILSSKPKRGNKMWSRRAQEYETKINSGEVEAIAEVVRDLYKNVDNDRSYSERTIYELALQRLASEIAALEKIAASEALERLTEVLREKLVAA